MPLQNIIFSMLLILNTNFNSQANNKGNKIIVLTFDDGPNCTYTPKILNTLKKHNIKATFFIMGAMIRWNKKRQAILKRIYREGHKIGNHTYSHRNISKMSRKRFEWEYKYTEFLIKKHVPSKSLYFRPPSGFFPKWGYDTLKKFGAVRVVFWDVYGDLIVYNHIKLAKTILRGVRRSKKQRVIVLLHDIYRRTTLALPIIIKAIKKDKNLSFGNLK